MGCIYRNCSIILTNKIERLKKCIKKGDSQFVENLLGVMMLL